MRDLNRVDLASEGELLERTQWRLEEEEETKRETGKKKRSGAQLEDKDEDIRRRGWPKKRGSDRVRDLDRRRKGDRKEREAKKR